jgi:hypothetical protein
VLRPRPEPRARRAHPARPSPFQPLHPAPQERDAERAQVDAERLASERRFYAELDAQEADFRSGGQHGMHKGRKKK